MIRFSLVQFNFALAHLKPKQNIFGFSFFIFIFCSVFNEWLLFGCSLFEFTITLLPKCSKLHIWKSCYFKLALSHFELYKPKFPSSFFLWSNIGFIRASFVSKINFRNNWILKLSFTLV